MAVEPHGDYLTACDECMHLQCVWARGTHQRQSCRLCGDVILLGQKVTQDSERKGCPPVYVHTRCLAALWATPGYVEQLSARRGRSAPLLPIGPANSGRTANRGYQTITADQE